MATGTTDDSRDKGTGSMEHPDVYRQEAERRYRYDAEFRAKVETAVQITVARVPVNESDRLLATLTAAVTLVLSEMWRL